MSKLNYIKLNDVQIAFPNIFKKRIWENKTEEESKYECILLLNKEKHKKEIKLINDTINNLIEEKKLDKNRIKVCIQDGDSNEKYEEYHGHYTISAKSKEKVSAIGKDGITPLTIDNDPFYGGCYVSVYIGLFVYNNKGNTGIGAGLQAIQFRKDGTPFNSFRLKTGDFDPTEDEHESEEDIF